MQKKNLKTFKLIHDNVLQYYQLMKYFMPQNFRNNQRGGRGGVNQRGGSRGGGFNNFNNRNRNQNGGGQRGGYKDFGNHGMNNGFGNTPAPGNQITPAPGNAQSGNTPAPNMMFNNMQFGGMGGMGMGDMQAFQQQMMSGNIPGVKFLL